MSDIIGLELRNPENLSAAGWLPAAADDLSGVWWLQCPTPGGRLVRR